MKTTQITVRNVDADLKRRIDKLARLKSMSLNDLALDALRDKVGVGSHPKTRSWEKYRGSIQDDDWDETVFEDFEHTDPKMWNDPLDDSC